MSASNRILKLLKGLSATPTGQKVYAHIRHNLEQLELGRVETEQAYIDLLNAMLDVTTPIFSETSEQGIELQLIRLSLVPGISTDELHQLTSQIRAVIQSQQTEEPRTDFLEQAISPLLLAQNNTQALTHPIGESEEQHSGAGELSAIGSGQQIDLIYQNQLDKTRESIQTIQNQLGEEIIASMQINDEMAGLLKDTMQTLTTFKSSDDTERALRNNYIKQCRELLAEHAALVTKLDKSYNKLHVIESSSQHLDEELTHLHRLSLTDELTGLPNRRAFTRRLEDEVARSRRYSTPLALAIIDLDKFKRINDQYGHAAGDSVLQCFARSMLSVFRHHDTTARYGGEEFAVLMPNTDIDGAFKALEKIRYIAQESSCTLDSGESIPMPSFSAGIALYTADESQDELLNRADTAMYRAKQMGRSRIEVHSTLSAAHQRTRETQKTPS